MAGNVDVYRFAPRTKDSKKNAPNWKRFLFGGEGGMDSRNALTPAGRPRGRRLRLQHKLRLEPGFSSLVAANKKRPQLGAFFIWRRGRDSNPRYACAYA